ncbi:MULTISPECIES: hypothetical protein [unclassified Campylobacter]|uniref:hypothetical protein n=1 Tax=unclassified Campylobacter TaxID=2593542 RepID=UPI0022E9FE5A|nr:MULTISPECIES: hypothetical protein [unclassified Campylobacter]MDA3054374.1 hypothetical protein [Campylobacter sp. VBCF_07 NA4]MDA3061066.1 hypothetical protein [Campylobacter sp. VBCF_02 NA5]MDA3070580.1 hypothetical protein [Campylobacter sp. VBCF_08 NA3]WBR53883.1 hypothetical protein PF027_06025 [Campylobacter sp. VBCF_01 NA2]
MSSMDSTLGNKENNNTSEEFVIIENNWFIKARIAGAIPWIMFCLIVCFVLLCISHDDPLKELYRKGGIGFTLCGAFILIFDNIKLIQKIKKMPLVAKIYDNYIEYDFYDANGNKKRYKMDLNNANITYSNKPVLGKFPSPDDINFTDIFIRPVACCIRFVENLVFKILNRFCEKKYIIFEKNGFRISLEDNKKISNYFNDIKFNEFTKEYFLIGSIKFNKEEENA